MHFTHIHMAFETEIIVPSSYFHTVIQPIQKNEFSYGVKKKIR